MKIFFKSNGSPRKWFRKLVFDESLVPRRFFKGLVFNSKGEIRAKFQNWLASVYQSPPMVVGNDWLIRRGELLRHGAFASVRSITIASKKYTVFVANALMIHFKSMGFSVVIVDEMDPNFNDDIYLVICPQVFKLLPPREKRLVFQMEQSVSSRWFNFEYINILHNSIAVFDYSKANIDYLKSKGISSDILFHIPISPVENYDSIVGFWGDNGDKKFEVLFYGDVKNRRRKKFLNILTKYFNVKIATNLFGNDLYAAISMADVVVNIHYYENALLESTRLCECLSLGASVVSEESSDMGEHPDWESFVTFTPIDDTQAMVDAVRSKIIGKCGQQFLLDSVDSMMLKKLRNALEELGIGQISRGVHSQKIESASLKSI